MKIKNTGTGNQSEKPNLIKELIRKLYITAESFIENGLFTYAASGAFSFLLSALPILLLVLTVLIRIFHESPEAVLNMIQTSVPELSTFNVDGLIASAASVKSIGLFEIIIGFSAFWTARRFFASFQQGLNVIYRKRGTFRPVKENLFVIAAEVFLVVLITIFTAAGITGNAFLRTMTSQKLLNPIVFIWMKNLFRFAPAAIIFIFLCLVYWLSPRIRPKFRHSVWSALACTVSFFIIKGIFSLFVNMTRYNVLYGFLSSVIVLLLDVYFFFFIFLFYAQYLYAASFYESFLITRLYLLPDENDRNLFKRIERRLFLKPARFYRLYAVSVPKDSILFAEGELSTDIYYVWSGSVRIERQNRRHDVDRGSVFGELAALVGGKRTSSARTLTGCVLLKIPAAVFQETIDVDVKLSRRTLEIITDYLHHSSSCSGEA